MNVIMTDQEEQIKYKHNNTHKVIEFHISILMILTCPIDNKHRH